ncbi:MAG: hypothetical protein MUP63_02275 [Candidatus Nanohaloarchaeota archaeon QJJ-7]|nr:hypothetical protein [Candidatus Nanohaloarchaeota archaeon QJJ-7]
MELEIVEREEKALLDREEIEIEISHPDEATPSAAEVRDKISAELDLDPKTVEVDGIYSSKGLSTSRGRLNVHEEPIHEELPGEGDEEEQEEQEAEGSEEDTEEPDEEVEDQEGDEDEGEEETEEEDETDETEESEEADDDG